MPERLRGLGYTFQRLPIYFVTACTHQREKILDSADIHTRLAEFGNERPGHGAWLGAYVLMPDHFHAFVVIDDQRLDLSAWMKSLRMLFQKFYSYTTCHRLIGKELSPMELLALGEFPLGGILAKIMAFPLPGTCAFLFTTHCDIGDCAQFALGCCVDG